MDNLTLEQRVLKPHVGVKPVEGHTVVVMEKLDGTGEEFRFALKPGETAPTEGFDLFQRLLGRRNDRYFSYAVTDLANLRMTFSIDATLRSRIDTIALRITFGYHVSDPTALVIRRNDDPVSKVKEEIAGLLRAEFALHERDNVLLDFEGTARDVISTTRPAIREFATTFGIGVDFVTLDHTPSPEELERLRQIRKAKDDKEAAEREADVKVTSINAGTKIGTAQANSEQTIALLKTQHAAALQAKEQELAIANRMNAQIVARFQRVDVLANALVNAGAEGIRLAGASIQNPNDLARAIGALRAALAEMSPLTLGDAGEAALPSGSMPKLLTGAARGPASVVAEMLDETMELGLGLAERLRLQSAILHLIAELMLQREAANDVIDAYVERIGAIRGKFTELEQLDLLEKYTDVQGMARRLR